MQAVAWSAAAEAMNAALATALRATVRGIARGKTACGLLAGTDMTLRHYRIATNALCDSEMELPNLEAGPDPPGGC
jgi:hypothetical protein